MPPLTWDQVGERLYETGVDHGVLYHPDSRGVYDRGFAWNGLTTVTESPSGAESNKQYADNQVYVNLVSAEEFSATIEAFTYPEAFAVNDGTFIASPGVMIGQQARKSFGLSFRTLVGNDTDGTDHGYKIHLVYGAQAAPSEKAYSTVNDSPEAIAFSWEVTTTPVSVRDLRPTAQLVITSTEVDPAALRELEDILYGTESVDARLPLPDEVIALFSDTIRDAAAPTEPAFADNRITIPVVAGIDYTIEGEIVTGVVEITEDTIVVAQPKPGFTWPDGPFDQDWFYQHTP